ncbi:hypothetical protein LWI29_018633 [Acer saccharum]|uniref:Uncharacterized protein n=1 Tax=Acer saccharum TaxID=4024 RepID=A0AA39SP34_ACESA|nr:hypothetical protein LWI29_018633 [Acer saccharum]
MDVDTSVLSNPINNPPQPNRAIKPITALVIQPTEMESEGVSLGPTCFFEHLPTKFSMKHDTEVGQVGVLPIQESKPMKSTEGPKTMRTQKAGKWKRAARAKEAIKVVADLGINSQLGKRDSQNSKEEKQPEVKKAKNSEMRNDPKDFLKTPEEDWFNGKINRHDHFDGLEYVDTALNSVPEDLKIEDVRRFTESCFGHFLQMHRQNNFSGGIVHRLLLRELHHDGPADEMRFLLEKHIVRFSKTEFCLITGLKFV